jgi:hypothetical protein
VLAPKRFQFISIASHPTGKYIINLGPEISTIQTKHLTQNIDDLERNKLTSKE